ncbi:MAG: oxidoreductase, partial [Synechococcus sp. CPC35]|nr:oxidoreductase [Synechococcus sp. CPC35]
MVVSIASHAIAPAVVLRGDGAWASALPKIVGLCNRPAVLGRSQSTALLRHQLVEELTKSSLVPLSVELDYDCCE